MEVFVTILDLTGTSPYDVYICDASLSTCIYVDTITSTPFQFEIPYPFNFQSNYILKIIDDKKCVVEKPFNSSQQYIVQPITPITTTTTI